MLLHPVLNLNLVKLKLRLLALAEGFSNLLHVVAVHRTQLVAKMPPQDSIRYTVTMNAPLRNEMPS